MLARISTFLTCFLIATQQTAALEISEIQGDDHLSPLDGQKVETKGVVTLWTSGKSFYLQSVNPDASAKSSEGIKVFIRNNDQAAELREQLKPGSLVSISGTIDEFRPFPELPIRKWYLSIGENNVVTPIQDQSRDTFRTITEIVDVTDVTVSGTTTLPEPIDFNPPGALNSIAFADSPNTEFDASQYPRDYLESLEGMRVRIPNAMTAGMKKASWTTFSVVSSDHLSTSKMTDTKLPMHQSDHIFPEILTVKSALGQRRFAMSAGTMLGDLVGVISYHNGSYILELETVLEQMDTSEPQKDFVAASGSEQFTIASINVKNLDPKMEMHNIPANFSEDQKRAYSRPDDDIADGKFAAIAEQIANQLKSPSVIGIQEIQDNDGAEITDVISAQETLEMLTKAIIDAGGAEFSYHTLDPMPAHSDGGQPGGNIRNAFLVRKDQAVQITRLKRLFEEPTDSSNPFVGSRKPLEIQFVHNGNKFRVINVHLKSKLGDQGLYSAAEDPKKGSTERRKKQMDTITAHIKAEIDPSNETVILLGDFNDYKESEALMSLRDPALSFVISEDDRGNQHSYSHQFGGIRSAIDFIAVTGQKVEDIENTTYVSGNVDDLKDFSDHNPVWVSFR